MFKKIMVKNLNLGVYYASTYTRKCFAQRIIIVGVTERVSL